MSCYSKGLLWIMKDYSWTAKCCFCNAMRFWDKLHWNQTASQMLDITNPLFIVCLTKETNYAFCHNWIGAYFHFMCLNQHLVAENACFASTQYVPINVVCDLNKRIWASLTAVQGHNKTWKSCSSVQSSQAHKTPKWFGREQHFQTWCPERQIQIQLDKSVLNSRC